MKPDETPWMPLNWQLKQAYVFRANETKTVLYACWIVRIIVEQFNW